MMVIFDFLTSALGLGGSGESGLTKIATEWIETDKEKAEAKSLFVKTLDPNGKMRRDLARFASAFYGYYLFVTSMLVFMISFNFGDAEGSRTAAKMMSDLFLPITTAWGTIVTASFGVNYANVKAGI